MGSVGSGYTSFKSEADSGIWGSRSFKGSGEEVNQFFRDHTNNYDLIDEASEDEFAVEAFNSWAVGDFMDGQQYDGFSNMSKEDQEKTRLYDDYLDRSVVNKGFITRRLASAELLLGGGNRYITEEQLKSMVGQEFISKGNMSTSAASTGLNISGEGNIEYVFSFPKGAVGTGMWIGDYRINDEWGNQQREYMTSRDIVFKMTGYKYNASRGVYEVQMKWTKKLEHDYS